jgi:hypothetical protein
MGVLWSVPLQPANPRPFGSADTVVPNVRAAWCPGVIACAWRGALRTRTPRDMPTAFRQMQLQPVVQGGVGFRPVSQRPGAVHKVGLLYFRTTIQQASPRVRRLPRLSSPPPVLPQFVGRIKNQFASREVTRVICQVQLGYFLHKGVASWQ